MSGTLYSVTLTNADNTISGAGHLGGGVMVLVNEGTIIATGTNALDIDTGTNAVTNTGMRQPEPAGRSSTTMSSTRCSLAAMAYPHLRGFSGRMAEI